MKNPNLNKKQNRGDKIFWIVMLIFTIFLAAGFMYTIEPKQMTTFEKIFLSLPGILILTVGGGIYRFFSNQVVDIKIYEDKIIFIKAGGKMVEVDKDKDIHLIRKVNGYVFVLEDNVKLKAYKYKPFNPFEHANYIDGLVDEMVKEQYMTVKY